MTGKRLLGILLSLAMLFLLAAPAMAADPQAITTQDLKGISAKRHRYIFSVLGGAAIGAGVGALVGSGGDLVKGLLVGGGGASTAYLHSNRRDQLQGWRPWALLLGHTALGSGIGWTICGCDDGAVAGTLIGAGASAVWQASQRTPRPRTATTAP